MAKRNLGHLVGSGILALALWVVVPSVAWSQQAASGREPAYTVGSFFYSLLYFPVKLTTCVGTQAGAAVAYVATYGVAGNYDGGNNGKEIGEVARATCAGPWVITPGQVKQDFKP